MSGKSHGERIYVDHSFFQTFLLKGFCLTPLLYCIMPEGVEATGLVCRHPMKMEKKAAAKAYEYLQNTAFPDKSRPTCSTPKSSSRAVFTIYADSRTHLPHNHPSPLAHARPKAPPYTITPVGNPKSRSCISAYTRPRLPHARRTNKKSRRCTWASAFLLVRQVLVGALWGESLGGYVLLGS